MSTPIICIFSLKNNVKVPVYFENKDLFATKIEPVICKLFDLNEKFNTNLSTLILRLSKDSPIFTYLSDDEQNIVVNYVPLNVDIIGCEAYSLKSSSLFNNMKLSTIISEKNYCFVKIKYYPDDYVPFELEKLLKFNRNYYFDFVPPVLQKLKDIDTYVMMFFLMK